MPMQRAWAVCLKEFRHIRRDPRILLLVVLSPAIMLVAFGYLFSFEVKGLHLAVLDYDRTPVSRAFVASLLSDGEADLVGAPLDGAAIDDLILRGSVDIALVIPPGLETGLQRGERVLVQAVVDGSDPVAASQNMANLAARTAAFSSGLRLTSSGAPAPRLDVRARSLYNPELKSLVSMVPGLLAIVLIVPGLAIVISITREKETGSFEGLVSTPVQGAEYIIGKLAAYTGFSLISAAVAFLVAVFWFGVPFAGNLAAFGALTLLYLLATMGFSVLVATFVSSQQAAMLIVLLIFFVPSFFLTGLIVPVNPESAQAQITALVLPATHYVAISRGMFLKGVGLQELREPAIWLGVMAVASVAASILVFRKEAV
ncbi:MAG: ABC transporter permease [Chloroflexota bacterium]|nr:ABC transporter permease [Chloroflexota bacterium]